MSNNNQTKSTAVNLAKSENKQDKLSNKVQSEALANGNQNYNAKKEALGPNGKR